jgi:hypothetical protein
VVESIPEAGKPSSGRWNLALPVAVAIATLLLWNTWLVFPLKIFVVFLHELSHGLAAILTGGSIERIELAPDQGGLCVTRGGARFVVLSAGYLGSIVLGATLLVVGVRSRRDRQVLGGVGVVTLAVTLLWVRTGFGLAFGLGAGAAMLGVAVLLPAGVSDAVLRILGTVSCLYAVWDIASDLLVRSVPGSDANALGELTGIPGFLWGGVWIVAAVAVAWWALRQAASGPPD